MSRASLPPVEIGAAAQTTDSAGEQGRPGRPLSRRGRVPRDTHELQRTLRPHATAMTAAFGFTMRFPRMGESSKEKNRRIWARRKQRYAAKPELMEKELARQRAWRRRDKNLKRKYGISLEGYSAMLARQNGVCAICLEEEVNKSLCVDHDHNTRMLRDLLCDACNKGLGHYRDDSALMRRGADYLDYWQACHE